MNPYYTPTGTPSASSKVDSRPLRTEFQRVAQGFDKFPPLIGANNKPVIVNDSGTGFTNTVGTLSLGAAFTTTGVFSTTLLGTAAVTLVLPNTTSTLATVVGTESLSGKTLVTPVFSGTITGTYTFGSGLTIASPTTPSPVLSGTTTGTVTFGGTPTINTTTFAGSTLLSLVNATVTNPTISSGALVMSNGYGGLIQFPSTQNPSADVNTFDDCVQGVSTPTITCETPGDLSMNPSSGYHQTHGYYVKHGRQVTYTFWLSDLPTYTTASGAILISLPFTAASSSMRIAGRTVVQGFTNITSGNSRGYALTIGYKSLNKMTLHYMHSTSGTLTIVNITDVPSAVSTFIVMGTIIYWTD